MSRRGRATAPAREAKAWHPVEVEPVGRTPVGIGNRLPDVLAPVEDRASLGDRVLACLATWVHDDGTVVEPTTGEIAARLLIAPGSYERDELNHVLTTLRQRRLLRYEHDPATGVIQWRLSRDGWGVARSIRTGTTGFSRSSPGDRSRDRFAKVRDHAEEPG